MSSAKGKFHPLGLRMTPSGTELGSFVRTRRMEINLSQTRLSQATQMHQSVITAIETGKRKCLSGSQLELLAQSLKCDVEELHNRVSRKHVAQPKTEIGKFIRARRLELGLSLDDFAKKMGIDSEQAKRFEIRNNETLVRARVKPLADALEISLGELSPFTKRTKKEPSFPLGKLIRARREELMMSLEQFAKKLGVTRQRANQIELNGCCLFNEKSMEKMAEVLELDVDKISAATQKRRLKRGKLTNQAPLQKS